MQLRLRGYIWLFMLFHSGQSSHDGARCRVPPPAVRSLSRRRLLLMLVLTLAASVTSDLPWLTGRFLKTSDSSIVRGRRTNSDLVNKGMVVVNLNGDSSLSWMRCALPLASPLAGTRRRVHILLRYRPRGQTGRLRRAISGAGGRRTTETTTLPSSRARCRSR